MNNLNELLLELSEQRSTDEILHGVIEESAELNQLIIKVFRGNINRDLLLEEISHLFLMLELLIVRYDFKFTDIQNEMIKKLKLILEKC